MKKTLTSIKFYLHGALVAALGAVSSVVIGGLQTGTLPTTGQLKQDGVVAICAGLAYLVKVVLAGSSAPAVITPPVVPGGVVAPPSVVAAPTAPSVPPAGVGD